MDEKIIIRKAKLNDFQGVHKLITVNTSLPADQISAFSLFLSFSLSVYKSIGAFRPHSCFPVTIQINEAPA